MLEFFKEISDQRKNFEKDFEEERKIFESEISKLTKLISELSTKAMKEQNMKSDFQKKIDLLMKERNSLSSKIIELEEIISKVILTEQKTLNSIVQTPRDDSADSECSFKAASSSYQTTVSTKRPVNLKDHIRTFSMIGMLIVQGE
ncbi:hypothetical protein L6452_36030 [Arctium lappa]|uniref:Uncharacterized protein n=1 Tax=Arctium lappa TaxID=4217 RepID=A0ACB8Y8Y9_ARCLA|nr:hypothetical protein L6452_36030 [Arctium lappa]